MNKICQITLSMIALALVPMLTACDALIYEDLEDCPQGVYISFYNQTPCMDKPQPMGEAEGLYLFVFDLNDVLVAVETVAGKADLNQTYKMDLPPVERGQYSIIAWAGVTSEPFELKEFVKGQTTKTDLMMSLQDKGGISLPLHDKQIWQGESKIIALPDRAEYGTVYKDVAINMLELTNRINITLKLHESVREEKSIDDFKITISSANTACQIDRWMMLGRKSLSYPGIEIARTDFSKRVSFTTLELKSGYNNVLRILNEKEGEEYFVQDLLGKVLLENPNVNLECTHDFDIVMEIEDKCKSCPDNNLVVHIIINNYQIHSFALKLSNRY